MRMIRPKIQATQVTIAEDQEEFLPVTAALVTNTGYDISPDRGYNTVVVAFRPSDEERARIARGEDLYLSLLTFARPMQGVILSVGERETAAMYGLEVER